MPGKNSTYVGLKSFGCHDKNVLCEVIPAKTDISDPSESDKSSIWRPRPSAMEEMTKLIKPPGLLQECDKFGLPLGANVWTDRVFTPEQIQKSSLHLTDRQAVRHTTKFSVIFWVKAEQRADEAEENGDVQQVKSPLVSPHAYRSFNNAKEVVSPLVSHHANGDGWEVRIVSDVVAHTRRLEMLYTTDYGGFEYNTLTCDWDQYRADMWHCIAGTCEGRKLKLWVDGRVVASMKLRGSPRHYGGYAHILENKVRGIVTKGIKLSGLRIWNNLVLQHHHMGHARKVGEPTRRCTA